MLLSIELKEVNLVWTGHTLNHDLGESSVGCDDRVAHHDFLSPYFGRVVEKCFVTSLFLIVYVWNDGICV